MPLRERYSLRACPTCGDLNPYGRICDNPKCPDVGKPNVKIVVQVVLRETEGTLRP